MKKPVTLINISLVRVISLHMTRDGRYAVTAFFGPSDYARLLETDDRVEAEEYLLGLTREFPHLVGVNPFDDDDGDDDDEYEGGGSIA